MSNDDQEPKVEVTSHNQSGGITAYKVTVVSQPPLDCEFVPLAANVRHGQRYRTEFRIIVHPAGSVIPNLGLEIRAPGIRKALDTFDETLQVGPERTGVLMTGHSGVRDGSVFTNIPNACGSYRCSVQTRESEPIEIHYSI